jgi:uncharacterized protein YggT (Ycf19 family)
MEALLPIFGLIRLGIQLYTFLILASVILSWVTFGGADHPSMHRAQQFLHTVTDPFLGPLRQLLMPLTQGIGLDFSPLAGIFLLNFIAKMLP